MRLFKNKKLRSLLLIPMMVCSVLMLSADTFAACPNNQPLPGMRSWYAGIPCDADNTPTLKKVASEDAAANEINKIVWTIALNIIATISALIGYVSIGFIIWGGFTYIISRGDPGNLAKGKKTVVRAVIGLMICILANSIVTIIIEVFMKARS